MSGLSGADEWSMGHRLELDDGACWIGQPEEGGGGSDRRIGQPAGADAEEEERD